MWLAKSLTRIFAFAAKEVVEVLRRPAAFAGLVLGPFLVMVVFGLGYNGTHRPLSAVVVAPSGSGLSTDLRQYQELAGSGVTVTGVTGDASLATAQLQRREVDVVVIAPANGLDELQRGRQSVLSVLVNEVDPFATYEAYVLADRLATEVNRDIIRTAAAQAERAGQAVLGAPGPSPDVVAQPLKPELHNIAPTQPGVVGFYAPAVLALILQHMAVTLTALSLLREWLSGAAELYELAPVSRVEILLGKTLGFGVLGAATTGALLALMIGVLGVPFVGALPVLGVILVALAFASLGLGLLISAISDSERQAVQLAMLVLLASLFFSGFVLQTSDFAGPVQVGAFALPVTSGIELLQDVMLRGTLGRPELVGLLAGLGLVFFVLTAIRLPRAMARR